MSARLLLAVMALLLAAPTAADAATRYAAPGASGPEPCAEIDPCDIELAVEQASVGDTAVVAPGDYTVSGVGGNPSCGGSVPPALAVPGNVIVTGRSGQPRPRIAAAAGTCVTVATAVGTLRHLRIENGTNQALAVAVVGMGTFEDLFVEITPPGTGIGVVMGDSSTIRNSVVRGPGDGAFALVSSGQDGRARNVTVRGKVVAFERPGGDTTMFATNTVATGSFRSQDLNTGPMNLDYVTLTVDHSWGNFEGAGGALVDGGGNQGNSPGLQFVDSASGDYHQLSGSITTDNGANDVLNGSFDFDGGARILGITDIGADEFGSAVATVMTGAAGGVGSSGATLSGTVNPNGVATNALFEYGTTTAYGQQTAPVAVGSDTLDHSVNSAVSGLSPATTYHYRIVGTNGGSLGPDRTLTTGAAPAGSGNPPAGTGAPDGSGPGGGSAAPSNAFSLGRPVASTRRGTLTLSPTLPGPGSLVATATASVSGKARTIRVARVRKAVARAGRLKLVLKPSRAALKVLRRKGRLRARLVVTFKPSGGTARTVRRAASFRLRRR